MDRKPGMGAIFETEEAQLWASGPDMNHQRFLKKADIKSTVTDSGNTPSTTLRAGRVLALKTSDGLCYSYDADANDGTQVPVGVVPRHLTMLDPNGTAEDKFSHVLSSGWLKNTADLSNADLAALAVLFRLGLRPSALDPHGSLFGLHMKGRYFKDGTALSGAYTVVAADHGCTLVAVTAAMNFTLPDLATVGKGFEVMLFNAIDANMIVTAAANTILAGDAGGAPSTTITFSTANRKMGACVLMYADYASDGGALAWYPYISGGGTPAYA